MAFKPHDFRDTIKHWSRMTRAQRVALVRQLVARSRGGDAVTEEMIELLALLRRTREIEPQH